MKKISLWLLAFAVFTISGAVRASAQSGTSAALSGQVTVAAAADLRYALDDIIAAFVAQNPGVKIKPVYGSSGNFLTQLQQHAPFDVFLSADAEYPAKLVKAGLASESTLFSYARGSIVLWVPNGSPLDVSTLGVKALLDPSVTKIAIANPLHAPYGRAAAAALHSLGVYDQLAPKFVLGENIAQTAQFVQSGAAQAGIIALALAEAPPMKGKGTYWVVPADSYPPLNQAGVILNWAQSPAAAGAFRDFILSDTAAGILKRYGFSLPQR